MIFTINKDYITLGNLLKISGHADTGGMAKILVKELDIEVNDIKENRRGRKLYPNDKVLIEGKIYLIKTNETIDNCLI